jgi:hypothetical protein
VKRDEITGSPSEWVLDALGSSAGELLGVDVSETRVSKGRSLAGHISLSGANSSRSILEIEDELALVIRVEESRLKVLSSPTTTG